MESYFTFDHVVSGKNHIGRKAHTERLRSLLSAGGNVVIYEAPKTGKSSLICQAFLDMKLQGMKFSVAELSLLNCRSIEAFLGKFASAIGMAHADIPSPVTEAAARAILSAPFRMAEEKQEKFIILLEDFQNILFFENAEKWICLLEDVMRKCTARQRDLCSFLMVGNQVNAMKSIFEQNRHFERMVERVRLDSIPYKELENYIIKGFLNNGKVFEKDQFARVYKDLRGDIYYLTHFASICDGLSRGYVVTPIVNQSLDSMIAIHDPRFIAIMNDLTTFQVSFLKAILEGQTRFSSAEVIEKYTLNSSANVRRLKDALCKKEIITFEKGDRAVLLDPLFEYWLRKYYFEFK